MANVNTYDGLKVAVAEWCNRNDTQFLTNIPVFIALAEQELFIDCSTLGNEKYITGTFNANSGIVNKPALWGKTLTFSYLDASNNIHVLIRSAYEFIRNYIPNQSKNPVANLPRYYTDYGFDYFLVSSTPRSAFNYEIAYFEKIVPLSDTIQTNWNTENNYDSLFYNTLDKAYRFLDNQADADMFKAMYKERVDAFNSYDQKRRYDRTANMMEG